MRTKLKFTLLPLLIFLLWGGTAYAYADENEAVEAVEADTETALQEAVETIPTDDYTDLLALIEAVETEQEVQEAEPNPFSTDGTGTVLDNATSDEGKEFFTITTEAGNVFYLIVDRDKETDNVYFLNAVTENDLMALAVASDTQDDGGIPDTGDTVAPLVTDDAEPDADAETDLEEESAPAASGGGMSYVPIIIAVAAIGGVGYYVKIVRPKGQDIDEDEDDFDDEDELEEEYDNEEDDMTDEEELDTTSTAYFDDTEGYADSPEYVRDDE